MIFGLRYIRIIRDQKVYTPGENWVQWVRQKSNEIGIKKVILFLQSELVKVPVTVGHLKPVILIPLGLLSQLSPQQVESILIHELAHIRRKDYLVNLLQSITDAVFFFNPAFIWISSLIRQEREKCCDDIVIQHSSRTDYLEALISFQDMQYQSQYSMALVTRKDSLLNRVKRMLTKENNHLTIREISFLLLGITIIAFGLMAFKQRIDYPVSPRPGIESKSGRKPGFSIVRTKKNSNFVAGKSIPETIKNNVPLKISPIKTKLLQELRENMPDTVNRGNNVYQLQTTDIDTSAYKVRKLDEIADYPSAIQKEVTNKNDTAWTSAVDAFPATRANQPDEAVAAVQKRETAPPASSGKSLVTSRQNVKPGIKPLRPIKKKGPSKPVIPSIYSE